MLARRDVLVEIEFLPTEQGGRQAPVRSGYRPQLYYDGNDWDASHTYPDVDEVGPGQRARAYLTCMSPQFHDGKLVPGKAVLFREGPRVVAFGTVTQVLDLAPAAYRARVEDALDLYYRALGDAVNEAESPEERSACEVELEQAFALRRDLREDGAVPSLDAFLSRQAALRDGVAWWSSAMKSALAGLEAAASGPAPERRPRGSFTSTPAGELPSVIRLFPSARYAMPPRPGEPIFPFDDKEKLVAWMTDALLGDLRTLERGIQMYVADPVAPSNRGFAGGNYLLASGCFLALEYFAQVYAGGDDATANVKAFLPMFPPFSARYVLVDEIFWRAFRNGLVHGSWPKVLSVEGKPSETIEFMVGVRPEDPHLAPFAARPNSFCLNAVQLLRDLETVVAGEFGRWVRETPEDVLNRGAPRRLEISAGFAQGVEQFELIRRWNRDPAAT